MDRYYVGEDDEEEDDDDHCDDVHDVGDDADDECGPEICGFRDSKKSVFFCIDAECGTFNPLQLRFWMSQLELEYHDLLSLFEFLDNGDGEITLLGSA